MDQKSRSGFTLIELVVALAVVSIAFYAIISVFATVAPRNINSEDLSKSTYLANRIMEETTAKNFAGILSVSATSFSSPFNNFNYKIVVDYVTTAEPDVVSGSPTPHKRIKAQTWGGLSATVEVITLVSTYGL